MQQTHATRYEIRSNNAGRMYPYFKPNLDLERYDIMVYCYLSTSSRQVGEGVAGRA